jgi:hypothetical protein
VNGIFQYSTEIQQLHQRQWKLFELQAYHFAEQITAISSQTMNEQSLHNMFIQVSKTINKLFFPMVHIKQEKKLYLFRGLDNILLQLDEAISIVSTVRSFRYIITLKIQVDELTRSLHVFSNAIELLVTCQRSFTCVKNAFFN